MKVYPCLVWLASHLPGKLEYELVTNSNNRICKFTTALINGIFSIHRSSQAHTFTLQVVTFTQPIQCARIALLYYSHLQFMNSFFRSIVKKRILFTGS